MSEVVLQQETTCLCKDRSKLFGLFVFSKLSINEWYVYIVVNVPNILYKMLPNDSYQGNSKVIYIGEENGTLTPYVKDKELNTFLGVPDELCPMLGLDEAECYVPVAKREKWYLSLYYKYEIFEPAEGGYFYEGNSLHSYDEYDSWEEAVKGYNEAFEDEEEGTVYKCGLFIRETKQAHIGEGEFLVLESKLGIHQSGYVPYE